MKRRSNKTGMTLFELLLVVAIMAILAGSGLPASIRVLNHYYVAIRAEQTVTQLAEAGLIVTRAIEEDPNNALNFMVIDTDLTHDPSNTVIMRDVAEFDVTHPTDPNGPQHRVITIRSTQDHFMRFIALR